MAIIMGRRGMIFGSARPWRIRSMVVVEIIGS